MLRYEGFQLYPFDQNQVFVSKDSSAATTTTYDLKHKYPKAINVCFFRQLSKKCIFWSQVSPVFSFSSAENIL